MLVIRASVPALVEGSAPVVSTAIQRPVAVATPTAQVAANAARAQKKGTAKKAAVRPAPVLRSSAKAPARGSMSGPGSAPR